MKLNMPIFHTLHSGIRYAGRTRAIAIAGLICSNVPLQAIHASLVAGLHIAVDQALALAAYPERN
jgi:hypothetical protein